jgi:hypothetical protein
VKGGEAERGEGALQSRAIKVHQGPSRAIRGHKGSSRSIKVHQGRTEAIKVHQGPSRSIKGEPAAQAPTRSPAAPR